MNEGKRIIIGIDIGSIGLQDNHFLPFKNAYRLNHKRKKNLRLKNIIDFSNLKVKD